jgi:hypothetical protein
MWAMLDTDNETVIAVFPPNLKEEDVIKDANGKTLIKITLENSPGWVKGTYKNGKFYPPKETING